MKDPKALFPFLFASSWLGNLLLTILAFYLAFSQSGPLTPFTLFTVAVCILSGNLLPISAYWLFSRYHQAELQAEAAEASVRVRDALRRSEEVMGRLDEAEGALAKAVLIARQVPDRIGSRFEAFEALATRLDTLEIESFTETLLGQGATLEGISKEAVSIQTTIKDLKLALDGLPKAMGKLLEESLPPPSSKEADDSDVSVDERLDLVYESLEGVQDSLDALLGRIAEVQQNTSAPFPPSAYEAIESEVEPEPIDEPEAGSNELEVESAPESGQAAEASEAVEPAEEMDDAGEIDDGEEMDDAGEIDDEPLGGQGEMPLEEPQAAVPKAVRKRQKGKVQLTVQAMVGISNKLYIRGDEPWLSWDSGQLMNLIGIGEFAWELDDLKEPIEVAILLNDELEAEGGRITLTPGKPVRVNLQFPKR
jgi:uncharacterized coiled-coil protein SlyX